ncbi:MarR family transcriptional regulator [Marinicauda pacifica]|uniref:MarR family transcriptional regulator n=1 Tax=Marinicauda pacifica TaxID=1133559 RepID=A0A4S2HCM9_9PROT|nr:MarR family winged helix-turn-helix transcriptional regulator [Marinicauda pacifica]TGY93810.1 MarR family transcriptional regulator [Marinicauda pacifica]GGE30482.1 MarR family transcriptional regulator [Marinicauda pacifica]
MTRDTTTPAKTGAGSSALRLSAYLPYRLSVVSNKVSGLIARAYQSRFGLTIWEWRVIAVLGEGAPMTAQGVCEATAMDKVPVSRAIRALDERGLVRRTRRSSDRRASDVELTGEGQRIYEEVAPLAMQYEASLLDGLADAERERLMALLDALEDRAEAMASAGDPETSPSRSG